MSVVGTTRRRFFRALALLVAVPALCGGVLGLALVAIGFNVTSGESSSSNHVAAPKPIRPIAIPARACSYLDAVRAAAEAARRSLSKSPGGALFGAGPDGKAWRSEYASHLARLSFALRVAAPHVPSPVRVKFAVVAAHADRFQSSLRAGGDFTKIFPTLDSLAVGLGAFQDASDLVGTACGSRLAPDRTALFL